MLTLLCSEQLNFLRRLLWWLLGPPGVVIDSPNASECHMIEARMYERF